MIAEITTLDREQVAVILEDIKRVKIVVYGDFCLDAYWILDPRGSEVSVETGLKAEGVKRHYYSPGGASNIVSNLAALQPAEIKVIGVVGPDIFGMELINQFKQLNVDTSSLFIQAEDFDTYTFVKKYLNNEEEPRIDFGVYNVRSENTDQLLLEEIRHALTTSNVLIFNQQVPGSITNQGFIRQVNRLFDEYKDAIVLLDSRHYNDQFRNIYRKINDIEIARMNGISTVPGEFIPMEKIEEYGENIYRQWYKPVFVTCGERGILTFDRQGTHHIQGIHFLKKLDTVGAGDTTLSALALCLAAGYSPRKAAAFANLAAAITVQKLLTTGTATGIEMLDISEDPDYIYLPDLAEDPRTAFYLPGTSIEICEKVLLNFRFPVKHVVFDHDGTISILRAGWEEVMGTMMVKAIMGYEEKKADTRMIAKVQKRVSEYIDKSTGVQTILQMKALVDMVAEFDLVSESERLDESGYKKLYLKELMKIVNARLDKLNRGEIDPREFIIPDVLIFMETLKKSGMHLYLASGTDQPDVEKEAEILGYATLFNGNIFGSKDDVTRFSKKIVIERIISDNDLTGEELMVVGDGPVEVRECRKKGGLAIGMATFEDGSRGINMEKRKRLIKAGAHIIMPDFTQGVQLIDKLLRR